MVKNPQFYGNFSIKNAEDVRYYTATAGQVNFSVTYTVGFVTIYQNGRRLSSSDFVATNGTLVTLSVGATAGDEVICVGRVASQLINSYTQAQIDSKIAAITVVEQTLTDASNVSWNVSLGSAAVLTTTSGIGVTRTISAPINAPAAGNKVSIAIIQDGTGYKNYSWNSIFKFPGGLAPTYTPWPNARDEYEFKYSGSAYQCIGYSLDVR